MHRWALLSTGWLLLAASGSWAYETDQFNNRLEPLGDSTALLNDEVNRTLLAIADEWEGPRDNTAFVQEVYQRIGGVHWVDRLERWAMNSPDVERLATPRDESIYAGHPLYATRVAGLFGVGPTIKVNDQLIGSDKLGHFLSQGRKFWLRYQRLEDESKAAEQSAYTERALFGQMSTGSYSNADLVANYEGFLFYQSLFVDEVISGKPAILSWDNGAWTLQRTFDFADHVNAYWDEAININHFDSWLYPYMQMRFMEFCPLYHEDPASFRASNEAELIERYAHLQLRDTSELRLTVLCEDALEVAAGDGPTSAD